MPRPRTGTVWAHGDHWDARITLPDGTRSKPIHMRGIATEEDARAKAAHLTEVAARGGGTALRKQADDLAETCSAWFERWLDDREERGNKSVHTDRSRVTKWVVPHFGHRPIRSVTKDDVEAFVEALDLAAREHALALEERRPIPRDVALSWKSALNVWGLVTKAFGDACGSKRRHLRVRADNPAAGVEGPDRGRERKGPLLHPRELAVALACPGEALSYRRGLALAVYSMLRSGELRALTWDDVDLGAGLFDVHRALDRHGEETSTKSEESNRYVKIEPVLLPMLRAMRDEAGGKGRVVEMTDEGHLSRTLRRLLRKAGLDRSALTDSSAARRPLRWHDLRATGLTYKAVRGDNPFEIKAQAGHEDFETTTRYVDMAKAIGLGPGDVFQPLPGALNDSAPTGSVRAESSDDTDRLLFTVDAVATSSNRGRGGGGVRGVYAGGVLLAADPGGGTADGDAGDEREGDREGAGGG